MDAVCALDARIMVKADNESVGRDIRERELSDRAVKRDRLSVADAPIGRALSCIRYGLDDAPFVIVQRRRNKIEGQRVRGRAGYDVDCAADALPALCGDDCICAGFRYGKYRRPRAGLCLDCYAALFLLDGCAGIDRYRDRRAKERQGHGVAVFYGHALRVGSLSV